MTFYATARFIPCDLIKMSLRHDTKLWFSHPSDSSTGICIGAVVGLNPGSSRPSTMDDGTVEVDPTMKRILLAFSDAYAELGLAIPKNGYIRMWNLCYLQEANSNSFLSMLENSKTLEIYTSAPMLDPTEHEQVPFLWFAWTARTPRQLALRSRRWWNNSHCPIAYLGPDGKPHTFYNENDCSFVRHPCRKSRQELSETAKYLLLQQ